MAHFPGTGFIRKWFAQDRPGGAVVPFQAPALNMARVCHDEREGMSAMLRDFAKNGSVYVLPWASLPLMVAMTDHDIALHHAVGEARATTPGQVRAVVSKLALSGALGDEARMRETQRAAADQSSLEDVELILIMHLLQCCGADLSTLMAEPGARRDKQVKAALAAAASVVGVKRQNIYPRIAELAHILSPIGLVATNGIIQPGWLRVLHEEISSFSRGQMLAAQSISPVFEPLIHSIAESARGTSRLSRLVLEMIDYSVLDIIGTIKRWQDEQAVLRQTIERLALVLDEWPSFMKLVHDALRSPAEEIDGKLRVLRGVLPRAPAIASIGSEPGAGSDNASRSASAMLANRLSVLWPMIRSVSPS